MKEMKWKERRPRYSSLKNEKIKELLREKSIMIIESSRNPF